MEKEKAFNTLLDCIPLLKPQSYAAKQHYLEILTKIFDHSLKNSCNGQECRSLLSYCLIHPAFTLEEKDSLRKYSEKLQKLEPVVYAGSSSISSENHRIAPNSTSSFYGRAITSSAACSTGMFGLKYLIFLFSPTLCLFPVLALQSVICHLNLVSLGVRPFRTNLL